MKNILTVIAVLVLMAGCATTKLIETPPGSGNYQKVAETDPRVTNALQTGTAVNDATALFNPWHGLVTVLLGAGAGIAEWNRRRKQAQLDAVVGGVEASGSPELKKTIQTIALAKGVEAGLNDTVVRVTGG